MTNTTDSRRRFRRPATIVGTGLALVLVGGIAWAIFLGLAKVDGGGQTGSFEVSWVDGTGQGAEAGAPSATVSGGVLTIPDTVFYPGDSLIVGGEIALPADASEAGYVSGVSFPGLPAPYEAKVRAAKCGTAVPVGGSASVFFEISLPEGASADGASWALDGAAVEVTPGTAPADVTCSPYVGGASS